MKTNEPEIKTVDDYIAQYSGEIYERLELLRKLIKSQFPNVIENISYKMPSYRTMPGKRPFIYIGTAQTHIGIYALHGSLTPELQTELAKHITGKGTLQFKNNEPLPIGLIQKLLVEKKNNLYQ